MLLRTVLDFAWMDSIFSTEISQGLSFNGDFESSSSNSVFSVLERN